MAAAVKETHCSYVRSPDTGSSIFHHISKPPLTAKTDPVMYPLSSSSRKRTGPSDLVGTAQAPNRYAVDNCLQNSLGDPGQLTRKTLCQSSTVTLRTLLSTVTPALLMR